MRVAVTGANGFVGRAVVRWLTASGATVTAVVRRPVAVEGASRISLVPELADVGTMAEALDGHDAVVHLAARVHVMREREADPLAAFRRVNVEGTRAVVDAAVKCGVAHVVYVSSVKVHGEGRDTPYRADERVAPTDPYGRTKLEAEELLAAAAGRLAWTVMRAPLVYGPGVGGNFVRLLRLADLAGRLPLPLGRVTNRRSLVFVDNLADAIGHVLASRWTRGERFLVSDGEDVSTSDLLARVARHLGHQAHLLPCPVGLLATAGRLVGRGAEVTRLLGSLTVDVEPLRQTGWHPHATLDDGLRATARWWRGQA